MTSKLKCPVCAWCNQPMVLQDDIFVCANTDCSACAEPFLHKTLIQAKKRFDRAKWWLKEIVENHRHTPITTAEMALKELDDGNL